MKIHQLTLCEEYQLTCDSVSDRYCDIVTAGAQSILVATWRWVMLFPLTLIVKVVPVMSRSSSSIQTEFLLYIFTFYLIMFCYSMNYLLEISKDLSSL